MARLERPERYSDRARRLAAALLPNLRLKSVDQPLESGARRSLLVAGVGISRLRQLDREAPPQDHLLGLHGGELCLPEAEQLGHPGAISLALAEDHREAAGETNRFAVLDLVAGIYRHVESGAALDGCLVGLLHHPALGGRDAPDAPLL